MHSFVARKPQRVRTLSWPYEKPIISKLREHSIREAGLSEQTIRDGYAPFLNHIQTQQGGKNWEWFGTSREIQHHEKKTREDELGLRKIH